MKKNANVTALKIFNAVGGKDNILAVSHCATRLRLTLKSLDIIDNEALKSADEIASFFEKNGQYQIILGTGFVNKVYAEFTKLTNPNSNQEILDNKDSKITFQSVTKSISDIFIPIIPVLLATGILMGLQNLLINGFGIDLGNNMNTIFNVLTGTAYVFIPVLVTWSTVKKFGGSPILGIVLGLMLVSPSLPDKWSVVNGNVAPLIFDLGFIDLKVTGYQSSVIPAIFLGFFSATLEKKLHDIVPDILDMLLVPFLTLFISLIFGLFLVCPTLGFIEKSLTDLILYLLKLPYGIGGLFYAGGIQILCAVGMHHTVTPIIVSIFIETGIDYINPLGSAAIAGQLGAGLAVVMSMKNKNDKLKMVPALIPALFGISETVMYGITFPRIKPFFMGCIGAGIGGIFAGSIGLAAKGTGASMLPGALLYLNGGLLNYFITLFITIASSYFLTYLTLRTTKE